MTTAAERILEAGVLRSWRYGVVCSHKHQSNRCGYKLYNKSNLITPTPPTPLHKINKSISPPIEHKMKRWHRYELHGKIIYVLNANWRQMNICICYNLCTQIFAQQNHSVILKILCLWAATYACDMVGELFWLLKSCSQKQRKQQIMKIKTCWGVLCTVLTLLSSLHYVE